MIRPANIDDNKTLTGISFTSKSFWSYPESYFEIWNEELTIIAEYFQKPCHGYRKPGKNHWLLFHSITGQ